MKKYIICVRSYLSNNSDYSEYDNYSLEASDFETAKREAKKILKYWTEVDTEGLIYEVYDVWESHD